jgi:phosphoglycerate dehydrogenase-like enzyme
MTLDLDNGIVAFPDTFGGGIGEVYELVDEKAAIRQGILLANAPGGSSPSVAELTIAMMIATKKPMN